MKYVNKRIALIFSLTVVGMSLVLFLAFRLAMTSYIGKKAEETISDTENMIRNSNIEYVGTYNRLFGEVVYLTSDYQLDNAGQNGQEIEGYTKGYFRESERIASWAKEHTISNKVVFGKIDDSYYYMKIRKEKQRLILIFVDTTPEYALVEHISFVLLVVLIVSLLIAISIGLYTGYQLEDERLKQKEFFENASHDLKTPLMVIQGYAEGMGKEVIPISEGSRAVLKEAEKMTNLVDEILHLSRLESGALKLQKVSFSLEDLLDNCLSSIRYRARQQGLLVNENMTDVLLTGDPQQLERALTNILDNSLRYAKTTITVQADSKQMIIANDGEPLTEEEKVTVFNRFYTGKQGRSGIGLALTQEIIRQHGWKISADNVDGQVRFTIKLK